METFNRIFEWLAEDRGFWATLFRWAMGIIVFVSITFGALQVLIIGAHVFVEWLMTGYANIPRILEIAFTDFGKRVMLVISLIVAVSIMAYISEK